ncbi:fanconi-associated nuclease 1-like, partial [Actinia tenebrosa]|uniref:Fanconi-associated nuclease n=1 Tax=Actinia tenebrosa TaxID=6105 RepID=A0A6P8IYZ3_ACTTE
MDRKSKLSLNRKITSNYVEENDDVESDGEKASKSRTNVVTVKSSKANTTAVFKSGTRNSKDVSITESKSKEITPQVKRSREKNHNISGIVSPKKRNRTIFDCWVNNPRKSLEPAKIVPCPACKTEVLYADINSHLDGSCKGGTNEDIECKRTGELSENVRENKPFIPPKTKQRISNTIAHNKSNTGPIKSLGEMNIKNSMTDILSDQTIKPSPSKYSSQNLISSNKSPEITPIDVDEDEEDILEGLNNELANPLLLSDLESDGKASVECPENLLEMKSALNNELENEEMGNKKANISDNYENDISDDMELGKDCASSDSEFLNGCTLKVADDTELTEGESLDMMEENNDATVNPEQLSDPNYLANFKLVLDSVLSNEEDRKLFNDADQTIIKQFQEFQPAAQKLYIRLFQRKPGWFRCSKLVYSKISEDLTPVLDTLVHSGFLENEEKMTNLKEALQLLSAVELKDLAKALHVIFKSTQQKKECIIECLIKHG